MVCVCWKENQLFITIVLMPHVLQIQQRSAAFVSVFRIPLFEVPLKYWNHGII